MNPENPQPEPTPPTPQAPEEAIGEIDIVAFLEKLVPPETVTIKDINGNSFTLPGIIAARQQIKVFRRFKELMEDGGNLEGKLSGISLGDNLNVKSIAKGILSVISDEEVIEELGSIFTIAYPNAIEGDPLDLFPIEEVVSAIVPLCLNFLKKTGGGIIAAIQSMQ